jgi:hypothetical protein
LFFLLFLFLLSNLFSCDHSTLPGSPCQIPVACSSVASADLLPTPVSEKFLFNKKYRVLGCHNSSLSIDFVVERREALGRNFYQDEIYAWDQGQTYALEIKRYKKGFPKKRCFDPHERIIACASEGPLLVLLTKNGLFSIIEVQKNESGQQNYTPFSLLEATLPLPEEIQALDLNEKNCNLTYDRDKKVFVFSYVSLLPFHPQGVPDAKIGTDDKSKFPLIKAFLCVVAGIGFLLIVFRGQSFLKIMNRYCKL